MIKHMATGNGTGNGSYRNNQLLPIELKVDGDTCVDIVQLNMASKKAGFLPSIHGRLGINHLWS